MTERLTPNRIEARTAETAAAVVAGVLGGPAGYRARR